MFKGTGLDTLRELPKRDCCNQRLHNWATSIDDNHTTSNGECHAGHWGANTEIWAPVRHTHTLAYQRL